MYKPKSTNIDITRRLIVIRPSPPICISIRSIKWPIPVKFSKGIDVNPVDVVKEVVMNKRSINLIDVVWQAGRARIHVPMRIVAMREKKTVWLGYPLINNFAFFTIIITLIKYNFQHSEPIA